MVDSILFDKLFSIFSKTRLILFGDFQQLEPVKGKFINQSKYYKKFNFKCIELNKIIRQNNKEFISILNKIRFHEDLYLLNKFVKDSLDIEEQKDYIFLFGTNHERINFNNKKLKELNFIEHIFEAKELPDMEHNLIYKETLKIMPIKIILKIGCRVMCVKNITIDGYYIYNGCLGTITNIKNKNIYVKFDFYPDKEIIIKKQKIPIPYKNKTFYYEQIPLTIGWAFTVHKVQGITLDKVIVDCKNIKEPRVLYVACSRVKTPEGLILLNFHLAK